MKAAVTPKLLDSYCFLPGSYISIQMLVPSVAVVVLIENTKLTIYVHDSVSSK